MEKYNVKDLNVYARMALARRVFTEERLKKNKTNAFAKYNYYDLNAIFPTLNRVLDATGLFSHIEINQQLAMLTIINTDKPEEEILFTMPYVKAEMKSSTEVQLLGSTQSYLSRYLLLTAFQIGEEPENDVDSTEQSEARENEKSKKDKKSSSIKEEVQALCREVSKTKRAEVSEIIKKHNNGTIAISKVEDEGILKKIKEEVEKL